MTEVRVGGWLGGSRSLVYTTWGPFHNFCIDVPQSLVSILPTDLGAIDFLIFLLFLCYIYKNCIVA